MNFIDQISKRTQLNPFNEKGFASLDRLFGLSSIEDASNQNAIVKSNLIAFDNHLMSQPENADRTLEQARSAWEFQHTFEMYTQSAQLQLDETIHLLNKLSKNPKVSKVLDKFKELCDENEVESFEELMAAHGGELEFQEALKELNDIQNNDPEVKGNVHDLSNSYASYNQSMVSGTLAAIEEKYKLDDLNDEQASSVFKTKLEILDTLDKSDEVDVQHPVMKTPIELLVTGQEQTFKNIQDDVQLAHEHHLSPTIQISVSSESKLDINPNNTTSPSADM